MSLEIDDDCPACGPGAPVACGFCDDQGPSQGREPIMTRKTTAPERTRPPHMPGCDAWHTDDVSCAEAAESRNEQVQPAKWDCPASPSRTQPSHSFDFSGYPSDDENECLHGCGITWDRLRGAE